MRESAACQWSEPLLPPSPLIFEPILMEKVWGGRRLESLGKAIAPGKLIGESWELADLASTSPSGGGGHAARSKIASGPLAGRTLTDAVSMWGRDLLGPARLTPAGGFPLLVKFLDARDNLSVQVHPSPGYAAAHGDAHLKTECWYILAAEPVHGAPAMIYKGLRPGVTRESLAQHAADGSIVGDLVAVPAVVGECHNLPSGTVHALGAGVLVAEVQTPSDTTFRLYDWGRTGRALHVREAVECSDLGPAPPATRLPANRVSARLVSSEFFDVFEVCRPDHGILPIHGGGEGPRVLIVLAGSVWLWDGANPPVVLAAGSTALIPASIVRTLQTVMRPGARALIVGVK